jgi:phosphomannomutase
MLRSPPRLPPVDPAARELYRRRYLSFFDGGASRRLLTHLASAPGALAAFFAELGVVDDVNQVDGLRVTLGNGEIVHLRPSGNAPELRCYAEADTPERAVELSRWAFAAASEQTRLAPSP